MTQPAAPVGPGVTLGNWRTAQFLRWSFQHSRQVVPTARVSRGNGPVSDLPEATQPLTDLPVTTVAGPTTVGAVLETTYTDGFLVLHDGAVVSELYPNGMADDALHAVLSVTKSLVGTVAGILVGQGLLDVDAPLTTYVPELAASGYAGATVRHVLDMRSGVTFSEDYLNPDAEIRRLEQCIGWSQSAGLNAPASLYDFLVTLRQGGPHGGPFSYRSCETDVLGWACERASGAAMTELLSRLLWSKLGTEHDADISVDKAGIVIHNGGLSASLRDLGRFGQLLLDEGVSLSGERVLDATWLRDAYVGAPQSRAAFAASPTDTRMPGGMYRNQFWVPYADSRVLLCLGIHGQMIYVNPRARTVGVKLSSWPVPQDAAMLTATLQAFDACATHLGAGSQPDTQPDGA
jgi:CubicO group peptidase (beta-lactamase class C family)